MICRLLPWEIADGPTNMAIDEILVRRAAESGIASLRFYGWAPATLSLGYFQPAAARLSDPRFAALPFVRRPSGGAALVHHHEVTYALAIPAGDAWQGGMGWMPRIHGVIALTLSALGLAGQIAPVAAGESLKHGDVLCFQQFTAGDLLCAGCKVVGSAQRKHCRALVQHGSILLKRSEHAVALPGLEELTGIQLRTDEVCAAMTAEFARETTWELRGDGLTHAERDAADRLAREKYATRGWNERR